MKEREKYERLMQKAQLIEGNLQIDFVILDLSPKWMKCRRTKRLVFQFHRLGQEEGATACGKRLENYQILPDRQEKLVITQVNMMLGGLGLLLFFDLCPQCFGNINRCTLLEEGA
ncbi:MAG: hypothetical protein ACK4LT_00205 [Aquificaceae bacterium]